MNYFIYKGGGLGDVMATSLLTQEVGKTIRLLNEGHAVTVVLGSHNKYAAEWYEWIEGLNVVSIPGLFDILVPLEQLKAYFRKHAVDLLDALPPDLESIEPAPFEYPKYGRQHKIVVQPFAGLRERCVLTHSVIRSLDRPEVAFIGRRGHRTNVDPRITESLPPLESATDYIDRLNVMESFDLMRRCEHFIGTYSCWLLVAWFLGKKTLSLIPDFEMREYCLSKQDFYPHTPWRLFSAFSSYYEQARVKHLVCTDGLSDLQTINSLTHFIENAWDSGDSEEPVQCVLF